VENEREVRLRRQIEDLVRSRLGALEQDISRLQREVNESFTRLLEQTDAASTISDTDELVAQVNREIGEVIAASPPAVPSVDIALLRDSVAELDEQTTQADVLNTLVDRASSFAPRVVLFVVKGTNALAWAARGFEDGVGNASIRGLSISLHSDTVLSSAFNSLHTVSASTGENTENGMIISRLGAVKPDRLMAVPLKVRGKSAALVFADSADRGEAAICAEAIELLVHTGGRVVELVSLRSRADGAKQAAAATPAAQAPTVSAVRSPVSGPLRPASGALAQPQPAVSVDAGTSVAGDSGHSPQPHPFGGTAEPTRAGQGGAQASGQASSETVSTATAQTERRSGPLDEEEKQHNDARRFARLLVSEIKLYNEQKVTEGRRNNDLYDRLKEDIDRSRQMYEKRVTPLVAAKFDYFYDELVNTLAEGDSARLGSDHPGPSVRM
jgi:hypothetical protein